MKFEYFIEPLRSLLCGLCSIPRVGLSSICAIFQTIFSDIWQHPQLVIEINIKTISANRFYLIYSVFFSTLVCDCDGHRHIFFNSNEKEFKIFKVLWSSKLTYLFFIMFHVACMNRVCKCKWKKCQNSMKKKRIW